MPVVSTCIKKELQLGYSTQIDEFLNHYRRKRKEVIGDGNCLFRCFSYILFNSEDKHPYLRQEIVEVIKIMRNASCLIVCQIV